MEEMKSAISPADSRMLNQKIWSLTQQHVELIAELVQRKADADEKLDMLPMFDTK